MYLGLIAFFRYSGCYFLLLKSRHKVTLFYDFLQNIPFKYKILP